MAKKLETMDDVIEFMEGSEIEVESGLAIPMLEAALGAVDDGTDIGEAIWNALEEEMREHRRIQKLLKEVDG